MCHSSATEAAFIYKEIFEERCYAQHGILVRDGDICVDIGANVGVLRAKLQLGPAALSLL